MKRLFSIICVCLLCLAIPGAALAAEPDSIVMTGRDATVAAGTETDNLVVFGGDARVFGRVNEVVVAIGGSVYLSEGAEVLGDVVTIGGTINTEGNVRIDGEQIVVGTDLLNNLHIGSAVSHWYNLNLSFWRLLSVLFLGLVTLWLVPRQIRVTGAAIEQNPLKAVLFGLLGYLAVVPVTITLVITILGIPLIPLLWLAVAAARLLGQVALGLLAGRWLCPRLNLQISEEYAALLGLLVLGLLTAIPVVGSLAGLFYGLVGFGGVLWTRFGNRAVILPPRE